MLWATNMEESINLNPFKMNSQIPEIDPQDLKFPLLDFDLVFCPLFPHYIYIPLCWNDNVYSTILYVAIM